jgi:hypothetical protein
VLRDAHFTYAEWPCLTPEDVLAPEHRSRDGRYSKAAASMHLLPISREDTLLIASDNPAQGCTASYPHARVLGQREEFAQPISSAEGHGRQQCGGMT